MDEVDKCNCHLEMDMVILDKQAKARAFANEEALKNLPYLRYCSECGEEIPVERVMAVPTTSRCIDCQIQYEECYNDQER